MPASMGFPPPLELASHPMGNMSSVPRLIQRLNDTYKRYSSRVERFVSGHVNRSSSMQSVTVRLIRVPSTCVSLILRLAMNLSRTSSFSLRILSFNLAVLAIQGAR